jgi:hypothetical protein
MGASTTFAQHLHTNGSQQQWTITSDGASLSMIGGGLCALSFVLRKRRKRRARARQSS